MYFMTWEIWIAQLALGILVAVTSSAVTVRFALTRFYREKWWERRYEAYAGAIAALGELHLVLSTERVVRNRGANDDIAGSRIREMPELTAKVVRYQYLGGLLMSSAMAKVLFELGPSLLAAGTDVEACLKLTHDAIAQANLIARTDLGLPGFR